MRFKKSGGCFYLSTKSKQPYEDLDWIIFYWGWNFDISYESCGYFDNRPRINLDLIFFSLTIVLPFFNDWTDECDSPKWGVSIHSNTLWVYKGGRGNMGGGNRWWTWEIPFVSHTFIRHSILLNDGTWDHNYKGDDKKYWDDPWKDKQMSWTYDYTDKYDGEVIPTKIYVEEREWRPKWLTWTKYFAKTRRVIDIDFSKECGKRKGSWKGGVLGCSYEILPNETPLMCLMRMEKERDL